MSPDFQGSIPHHQRVFTNNNYLLPSDEEESCRLQRQHELIRLLFEHRLVLSPLDLTAGAQILDVGAGNAAWATDFLASYPGAREFKIDLVCIDISSRLFPEQVPSNIEFHVKNVLDMPPEWTNCFALVHQRFLMVALKTQEWERAVEEVYRVTKTGGAVQFCEANTISHMDECGPATAKFMDLFVRMCSAVGLDPACSLNIPSLLEKAGFINIQTQIRIVQVGDWNGDAGVQHKANMMGVYRGFKTPILRLGGLGVVKNEVEFDRLIEEVEEELKRPGAAKGFYIITGTKPTS